MNSEEKRYSPSRALVNKFLKQRVAVIAFGVVVCIVLIGLFGSWFVPFDPSRPVTEQYERLGIITEKKAQGKVNIQPLWSGGTGTIEGMEAQAIRSELAITRPRQGHVDMIAISQGTTPVIVRQGDVSSVILLDISELPSEPILSRMIPTKPERALQPGDSFRIDLTGVLTNAEKLSGFDAVKRYIDAQQAKLAKEEKKDDGFITSAPKNERTGLAFESLTPDVLTVDERGSVKVLKAGHGRVRVAAGDVSSVLALPVQVSAGQPVLEQLVPETTELKLYDVNKHQPPSSLHWMGTDHVNRDIFSRIIAGTKQTLIIGFVSVFIGATIGTLLGLLAGYYGRWMDTLITRFTDILLSFPGMLLAIFIIALRGPGLFNIIFAVATFTVPIFIRIVRGSALSLKQMTYVEAAKSIGVRDSVIILRHIFPGTISVIMIYLTMRIGTAILIGAGLSYLGLGGDVTASEWGSMLNAAKDNSRGIMHPTFFPGLAIVITVLSFNLFGDGLRDALDPKLKE